MKTQKTEYKCDLCEKIHVTHCINPPLDWREINCSKNGIEDNFKHVCGSCMEKLRKASE